MADNDIFAAIARSKGRDNAAGAAVSLPFSAAAAKTRAEEEARMRQARQPGDVMPDGTVYLGDYMLAWWTGNGPDGVLKPHVFDMYAAAEDLPMRATFRETARALKNLRGLHGHDGAAFHSEAAARRALRRGKYDGEWMIPTAGMMDGVREAFKAAVRGDDIYWSSSPYNDGAARAPISSVAFGALEMFSLPEKREAQARCRLVRLERREP